MGLFKGTKWSYEALVVKKNQMINILTWSSSGYKEPDNIICLHEALAVKKNQKFAYMKL